MKRIWMFGLVILGILGCQPKVADALTNDAFPESWVGNWGGQLRIYNSAGVVQEVEMELRIAATDSSGIYNWTIVYVPTGKPRDERHYKLLTKDASRGHFLTDEQNSILLDDYFLAGTLYSRFEVMNNLLLATYRKEKGAILFEIVSGSLAPTRETGGTNADIPLVRAFPVNIVQKAVLKPIQ